jgi:hypothetical protein
MLIRHQSLLHQLAMTAVEKGRSLTWPEILSLVADAHQVRVADLIGPCRARPFAWPRQAAMWFLRDQRRAPTAYLDGVCRGSVRCSARATTPRSCTGSAGTRRGSWRRRRLPLRRDPMPLAMGEVAEFRRRRKPQHGRALILWPALALAGGRRPDAARVVP